MLNFFNKKSSANSEQVIRNILNPEDEVWYWDPQSNKVETAKERARKELARKESRRVKKEMKKLKKKKSKRAIATSGK